MPKQTDKTKLPLGTAARAALEAMGIAPHQRRDAIEAVLTYTVLTGRYPLMNEQGQTHALDAKALLELAQEVYKLLGRGAAAANGGAVVFQVQAVPARDDPAPHTDAPPRSEGGADASVDTATDPTLSATV
jgi:hypothetical protein